MNIGFTGTRKGMSDNQKDQFRMLMIYGFEGHSHFKFHHGAAIGADREAHEIVRDCSRMGIVKYPADKDPLERNQKIVDIADLLIAAPETDDEQLRSGTWFTIRRARKKGIPIIMLPRGE